MTTPHPSPITHHPSPRAKTTPQVRAIFGEGRKCGLDKEGLEDIVADITRGRTHHISALTYVEAERVIERLKGKAFTPRRTLQYRRAKQGIKQVVQEGQIHLIAELATQRNWSAEALVKFCKRQCGHHPLRTTEDANKVIEALKSMNERNNLWAAA
jgi:uncharacterized protein with PIN domain